MFSFILLFLHIFDSITEIFFKAVNEGDNIFPQFIYTALSPSAACYGESASTLRWAARARQLPTPRATNINSNITSRAVLQAQFNQLISELTRNHIRYVCILFFILVSRVSRLEIN